jgi:GNAT superfamily N-acetyltransferase
VDADVMSIRTATFDDLGALVDLAGLYHAEAHAWLPFDQVYVREQFLGRTIDTSDGITRLLIGDGGVAVGFLAATVTQFFAAPVRVAVELAWYVAAAHRGKGDVLLDDFEEWARLKACAACSLAMNEFPDPRRSEALARLYGRRGYRCYERGFLKRL